MVCCRSGVNNVCQPTGRFSGTEGVDDVVEGTAADVEVGA
jgi:hypothetical protein